MRLAPLSDMGSLGGAVIVSTEADTWIIISLMVEYNWFATMNELLPWLLNITTVYITTFLSRMAQKK